MKNGRRSLLRARRVSESTPTSRHVWLPGLSAKGGIQTYGRFLASALDRLDPSGQNEYFLKNDVDPPLSIVPSAKKVYTFGRWPGTLRSAAFAGRTAQRAIFGRPDHILVGHLHFVSLCNRIPNLAAPWWVFAYGIESWSLEDPPLRSALKRAGKVLAISRYTRERLIDEQGVDRDKISLLPCTFDADTYRIRSRPDHLMARHGVAPDQPILLTVARLADPQRQKGYDQVLEALPAIRARVPDVRYLIVGDGPDRTRLARRIRGMGLDEAVTIVGEVQDEELPFYYALSDVFVMPSSKEGFGIVFLEAMACGVPSIGGCRDGARDPLMDGELGVLVDPGDPREIAEASIGLLRKEHPNQRLFAPEVLRTRAIEEFGPERFRNRLGSLLEDGTECVPSSK